MIIPGCQSLVITGGRIDVLTIKVENNKLDPKMFDKATQDPRVQKFLYSELKRFFEPYVPSVTLAQSARINSDSLEYPGPYAHFQYTGLLMVSPTTGSPWATKGETKVYASPERALNFQRPGATAEWADTALENHGEDLFDELAAMITKVMEDN